MKRWAALLVLAGVVALALRLPQLGVRPMHNDEAVNAVKFASLWERGTYAYDPREFHGPALHYGTAALCWVTGAPGYTRLSEARLRWLTVLAGVALVLLVPLVRDALGRGATVAAALFTALSPAMVFFSRYWIHEALLVLFTFLTFAAVWRYVRRPSWPWAVAAGASCGLMQASKETFVFNLAAGAVAVALSRAWFCSPVTPQSGQRITWRHVLVCAASWLLVWLCFFSSFFSNPAGLLDSFNTYFIWLRQSGSDSPHVQPWYFHLQRLFWFHSPAGPVWSEALLLLLAVAGTMAGFRRTGSGSPHAPFIRWLFFYTLFLALIYSVIPYKTPWCVLGVLHGLILLAGVGAIALWQALRGGLPRLVLALFLFAGCGHLGWQAWRASIPLCADRANPWVYAQTSPDLLNLIGQIHEVTGAGQGSETLIHVIARDGDYWPLPWYLRDYTSVGWWDHATETPEAPIVVSSAGMALGLEARQTHVMAGYFQLRPKVFLELHVERELWEKSVARH